MKTFLQQVMASYNPPIPCPSWIDLISNDWDLVYQFRGTEPGPVVHSFQPKAYRPETTPEEQGLLGIFDKYLVWDFRSVRTIRRIQATSPDELQEIADPGGWWPP